LLFPETCAVCGRPLTRGEEAVCNACLQELPFTGIPFTSDNAVARRLQALAPVEKATALMWYGKDRPSAKVIRLLKYGNRPRIGRALARHLAPYLEDDPPDLVIPVPLHPRKLRARGYNQLEEFGRVLAGRLGSTYADDLLVKFRHTPSQTRHGPWERWKNVAGTFKINNAGRLCGRKVLIVDDVLTTGATLGAAASVIREACPSARIYAAVMAFNYF